jgi:hypothetical protein
MMSFNIPGFRRTTLPVAASSNSSVTRASSSVAGMWDVPGKRGTNTERFGCGQLDT